QTIRNQKSGIKIAVSFFSPSGFEMYQNSGLADVFFYIPLDTRQNAANLIKILNPVFSIFIRNEIWWNTLTVLKEKNVPAYLVNANLNQKRNIFYKKYLDKTYPLFKKIFDTQTFGNTKLEKVIENKNAVFNDRILEDFCKDGFVVIFGSSWEAEDKIALDFYKKNKSRISNLKIIIVPHEYDESKKSALENLFQEEINSYSSYAIQNTTCAILLLDKKGILKYAYRYATIAVIGGGFGKSVHNISEAAVYGIPTIFGPNYSKFEDAKELVNLNAAFPVNDYMKFENKLIQLTNDAELRTAISQKLNVYFSQQENAAYKIIAEVLK
ncbi:MAG: hypothetical protein IT271_14975, partial [Chitinophagales bacterium]|nr:hypothetical protein [Chitinophagales bacterium]